MIYLIGGYKKNIKKGNMKNMKIEDLYKCIEENNTQQILPIIDYISENYKNATLDDYNLSKSQIPTWRIDKAYVGIGCRKHYISVYFSSREAVTLVADGTPYCRAQKGCVNFSYKRELPLDLIYKAIDKCFNEI